MPPSRRDEVALSPSSLLQFTRPELCSRSLCSDSWDKPDVKEHMKPSVQGAEPELSDMASIQDPKISVHYPRDPCFGESAPVYEAAFGVTPHYLSYWSHSVTRLTSVSW